MMKLPIWNSLSILLLLLAACVPVTNGASAEVGLIQLVPVAQDTPSAPAREPTLAEIVLPVVVYIIDDEEDELSSARTAEEFEEIYDKANQIWGQANIRLTLEQVARLAVPQEIAEAVNLGNYRPFFQHANGVIDPPSAGLIYAFYTQSIGGPNGIAPFGARAFFVMDTPSVHDERVTSHEIGHILGLHHTLEDNERLMYPGTNGMTLTEEEIVVARYVAMGMLANLR